MPRLRRISDGEGCSGSSAECIKFKDGKIVEQFYGAPKVGYCYRVGSLTAGTYTSRDFWTTSEITEILEVKKNGDGLLEYVKFKTGNSVYECKA